MRTLGREDLLHHLPRHTHVCPMHGNTSRAGTVTSAPGTVTPAEQGRGHTSSAGTRHTSSAGTRSHQQRGDGRSSVQIPVLSHIIQNSRKACFNSVMKTMAFTDRPSINLVSHFIELYSQSLLLDCVFPSLSAKHPMNCWSVCSLFLT